MKTNQPNKKTFRKSMKQSFFQKHKSFIIGTGSILAVAGLSFSIAAPFLTKAISYYVSNANVNIKGKKSLFFVTDGGDVHDGSFNEAAYNTVTSIGGKYNYETPTNSNFSSLTHSYNLAVSRGASVLELNGFLHAAALKQFSHDNPTIGTIFLDSPLLVEDNITKSIPSKKQGNTVSKISEPWMKQQGNVASIIFKTEQVGYLAGFAAAAWANINHKKNGKSGNPIISGVGGLNIPPVTTYLAGFEQGMDEYNKLKSAHVELWLRDNLKIPNHHSVEV